MDDLTQRQRHVLVAMLELEEGQRHGSCRFTAGKIAWVLGFRRGPRQGGNGAKSRRSFSGWGGRGKWLTGSLLGLEKRELIRRTDPSLFGGDGRVMLNSLTERGLALAKELRERGVTNPEVKEVREPGVVEYVPV